MNQSWGNHLRLHEYEREPSSVLFVLESESALLSAYRSPADRIPAESAVLSADSWTQRQCTISWWAGSDCPKRKFDTKTMCSFIEELLWSDCPKRKFDAKTMCAHCRISEVHNILKKNVFLVHVNNLHKAHHCHWKIFQVQVLKYKMVRSCRFQTETHCIVWRGNLISKQCLLITAEYITLPTN